MSIGGKVDAKELKGGDKSKAKKGEKKEEEKQDESKVDVGDFAKLDIRVGKLIECTKKEDSDKLYCTKVDIGLDEPR